MDDIGAMHFEIEHLRALARLNTDARVLDAIEVLTRELRHRIERAENLSEERARYPR